MLRGERVRLSQGPAVVKALEVLNLGGRPAHGRVALSGLLPVGITTKLAAQLAVAPRALADTP